MGRGYVMKQLLVLVVVLLALFILYLWVSHDRPPDLPTRAPLPAGVTSLRQHVMTFLPPDFDGECETLFKTPGVKFTPEYLKRSPDLGRVMVNWGAQKVRGHDPRNAGKDGEVSEEDDLELTLLLHALSASAAKVCVTSVTSGHPPGNHVLSVLTSNRDVIVHAFDPGKHPGTRVVSDHLTRIYGNRLQVHPGDPKVSIRDFYTTYVTHRCDVIIVSGDQLGEATWWPLEGLLRMSEPGRTVVVMEGYPTEQGAAPWRRPGVGGAWELARHRRHLVEAFRCTFQNSLHKQWEAGFSVGVVAWKPKEETEGN